MRLSIPYEDCINLGPFHYGRRLTEFEDQTGVFKTRAGRLALWDDRARQTYLAEVTFDSRAWTGRA